MFSKDFYEAWVFIPLLTLGVYYNSLNSFLGSIFTASKQTKHIFYTTAGGAVINVILNTLLIPFLGGQGAAAATLISYMVVWLVRSKSVKKILNFRVGYIEELVTFILLFVEGLFICNNTWEGYLVAGAIMVFVCLYSIIKGIKRLK